MKCGRTQKLIFKMKAIQIIVKPLSSLLWEFGAVRRSVDTLGQAGGKYQTGGLAAFTAVGSRQAFKDLKEAGPRQSFKARLDLVALFPGPIDLCNQPLQNLFSFIFIFEGINGNLARMQCDQTAAGFEN